MNRHSTAIIGATLLVLSAIVCTIGGLTVMNSYYYQMRLERYLLRPSDLLEAGAALKTLLVVLPTMTLLGVVLLMVGLSEQRRSP